MKRYFSPLCFLFMIATQFSCTEKELDDNTPIVTGFDQFVENDEAFEIIDLNIIELSPEKDVLLSSIERVAFTDSIIIVKSDHNLFSFDLKGKFLNKIGNRGRGHGEYVDLYSFFIDKERKEICIVDQYSRSFLYYNYKGLFLRKEVFESNDYCMMQASVYLGSDKMLCQNYILKDFKNYLFSEYDIQKKTYYNVMPTKLKTINTAESFGGTCFSVRKDDIKLIAPFENTIYKYKEKNTEPFLRVDIPKSRRIPKRTIKQIIKKRSFNFFSKVQLFTENYFAGFNDIFETDDYIFLNELPGATFFIINKNKMTGTYHEFLPAFDEEKEEQERFKTMPLINIRMSVDNKLVGFGDYWTMERYFSLFPDDCCDKWMILFKDYFNHLDKESNPCLLLYELSLKQ